MEEIIKTDFEGIIHSNKRGDILFKNHKIGINPLLMVVTRI